MATSARVDITIDTPFPGLQVHAYTSTNDSGTFVKPRITLSGTATFAVSDIPALLQALKDAAQAAKQYTNTLSKAMGVPTEDDAIAQGNPEAIAGAKAP